jgi:ribosomal peptide maturation radical SAM protein 1
MFKIALVNMPLSSLTRPSLALTQLQSVVRKHFPGRADASVHYLHHDFAHFLGMEAYEELNSFVHHGTGLGDWFFRATAWPGVADNADEYFQRYYPQHTPRNRQIREMVLEKRAGLETFLDAMIDHYELDKADLVGLTSMFSQHVATLAMAQRIKQRNPEVTVVVGGANCEGPMGRALADNAHMVDFVFSGPSLRSFPRLVGCLLEGDLDGAHRIDGVFSRRNVTRDGACGTGGLVALGGAGAVPEVKMFGEENDINELVDFEYEPFLDAYEAKFPGREKPYLLYETSRGCWWGERAHCTFCGLNGSTISYRSMRPDTAFKVFNDLFQYSDRVTELQSVDNILPKSYFSEVLPFLDTPENMAMFYEVKADLSEDDFRVLARARVLRIQPGIEAMNTSTLKLMRKGTSVFQNLSFLMNALRYDIGPIWNLLIGFPGEEITVYEKYLEDLPLLTHLSPPMGVFPVRFDRFSPYYVEAKDYGLELEPLDWYALTYPFPRESLADLAYYFADQNYGAAYALNAARMVNRLREKVHAWQEMWEEGPRPELRLQELHGMTYVFDSRSGSPDEYPISDDSRRVLEALSTAKKPANVVKELPDVDVEGEIARLRELGLIFWEGERYMSLIITPPRPVGVSVEQGDFAAVAA